VLKDNSGSDIKVDGTVFCMNSTGAPSSGGLALSTSNMVGVTVK